MPSPPLFLIILDGWGLAPDYPGNAVTRARTPTMDLLFKSRPHAKLKCWGEAVGLPEGQMGNSEVGHLNLGAGRIVYQDITRIDRAIRTGDFFIQPDLLGMIRRCRDEGTIFHLLGLVSDGGVHSHMNHLLALLQLAKKEKLKRVMIQAITDGRDTPPKMGLEFIRQLQQQIREIGAGRIASICGRFYAMDRDNRWERVERAFRALTAGQGILAPDPVQALEEAYQNGETDEFIAPRLITGETGLPLGTIQDGDAVFFFNFRADRAREITRAFIEEDFTPFPVAGRPKLSTFMTMTEYDTHFSPGVKVAFPPQNLVHTLGETISRQGIHQLRIAETEKYAHVTYFFNGGVETPFPLEERCLIPSTREVPTYDLKPAMSALEVTREIIKRIGSGRYGFMVVNFANLDMVGHTGNLEAAIRACEVVDTCLGQVIAAASDQGGILILTGDHGNAEEMIDRRHGGPHTAHTSANPVPFLLIDPERPKVRVKDGILADVAPTLLALLKIPIPEEMTGTCLLE
ncbi:MAG: 2,3-bisphosphoglycerate-independent phosphoglycerate mutase [Deltaproteobacteria bacterium]|nr:2,3-bisphosphoglycerate-independent phosphoglycerate mutase [Deltaproteobacteria bacterium]